MKKSIRVNIVGWGCLFISWGGDTEGIVSWGGGSRIVAISRIRELLDLVRRDGRGWGWEWGWSWVFASGVLVDGWMDGEVVLLMRRRVC